MKKIKFTNVNRVKRQKETKGFTFVVAYQPLLKSLQSLIKKHLNNMSYIDEGAKKFSTPRYMITFRTGRKLINYLLWTKLYLLKRVIGSCKCNGKYCPVCMHFSETSAFTSSVIHET